MFRQEKQELAYIVLPDKRIIKRRIYSKYIANNSPVWVIVGGVKFYIDYYNLNNPTHKALGNLYKLDFCTKKDFGFSNHAYIIDNNNPDNDFLKVDSIKNMGAWYNKHNSFVNPCFFDNVKR